MPEAVDACVKSVLEDNPDYSESRAYAICWAQQNRDELSLSDSDAPTHDELIRAVAQKDLADDGGCKEGHVNIDGKCVPVEEVEDVPPSAFLSSPMHLTLASLDTEPIERLEEGDNTVRYKSLKLLSPGVWTDSGSETATLYPPEGIANLKPDWDDAQHDGPPVNIMHDLDVEEWEAHEPSVAGYIDPDTVDTDDDGNLFADIVLDTSKGAGQYADDNLRSTLQNQGTVGFGGPSVEIPARGLEQSTDPVRDIPRIDAGLLTGTALVMEPASKAVNFAREAARRPIAMANGGNNAKVMTRESDSMRTKLLSGVADKLLADPDELRETLDMFGFDGLDEMTDDEVVDMAEDLHADLTSDMEGGDDGQEMEDGEDDDEEDEDTEMEDDGGMDDIDAIQETVQNLASRLEDLEDAMSQAMTADDVNAELEDAAGNKLADAETVKELEEAKEEIDRRLSELEDTGKDPKTLSDAKSDDEEIDWSSAESGITYDSATGSMSR